MLAAQCFSVHAFIVGGVGSIPGQGTKIPMPCRAQPKIRKLRYIFQKQRAGLPRPDWADSGQGNGKFLEEGRGAACAGWPRARSVAEGTGERVSGTGECFREKKLMSLDLVSFWGETDAFLPELVCLGLGAAVPANELSLSTPSVPRLYKEGLGTPK